MSADAAVPLIQVTQDAYELRGVVRLTLNRPDAFNALSEALLDQLQAILLLDDRGGQLVIVRPATEMRHEDLLCHHPADRRRLQVVADHRHDLPL